MKLNPAKSLLVAICLALVASCGGGDKPGAEFEEITEMDAKDVEPPVRIDAKAVANPGLTLSTNSPTWQRLVNAPVGRGAVVLFVQPGAAADKKGIRRGDLILEVDGERVYNGARAQSLLWSANGEERHLKFKGRKDKDRDVTLKGEILRDDPRKYVNVLIDSNPTDPVLRYIRAGLGGNKVAEDVSVALAKEPNFPEALARQGEILFRQSAATKAKEKEKKQISLAKSLASFANALDINPRHAETIAQQSLAQTALGRGGQGKTDALKALRIDASLASANYALAQSELALKKPANAAGPARAAVASVPIGNLDYYRLLARVFSELEEEKKCRDTLLATVPWLRGTKTFAKEATQMEKEARENCG